MKRLDRFILKSFIGPFIAILLVVVFILMMQFLWLYIDELVGKGLSLKVVLEFLGWGSATLLPLSLPLATLLASMMTMGSLGENNELLAIKAAGISLRRVLTPLMCASAIISVLAFFAADDLVPVAYNKIFTLRDDIGRTKEEIKIPTQTFYDGIEGYILRVESRDDKTGMMHGVMVYNHSGNKGNVSLTLADSALMKMTEDKKALTFTLFSGSNYEETNTRKYRDTTLQLQSIDFSRQSLVIPLENYAFQKSEDDRFSNEVKSMSLKQLERHKDSVAAIRDEALAKQLSQLADSRAIRFSSQLDTSRNKNIRVNFDYSVLGDWKSIDARIDANEKALSSINDYISTLTTFSRETYYNAYILRRSDVEILKKFAGALACFILFFIGAPLGAIIRKGGLGTPAIISVLFFVLYWVVDITGTKLANDGAISPSAGVFISSYVLFPIGLFLSWKAINDSSIFNTDKLKEFFKKIRNKVFGRLRKTRIVYMGTPEFAVAPLDTLRKNGYNVVGVVTVADKASGRGLKVNESAVKKYAVANGIPVLQPLSLKDPEFLEALKGWNADLFVVVAFRMLPKAVWSMPKLGTFNLHAALLPQYRGAAPINWAVINGDNITGVTTFMIDEGMDTGHIIMREQCRISATDTAGDIHDKLMETGAKTVLQTVDAIMDKDLELRLQKSFIQGSERLRPAPKLSRELCNIDWRDTSRHIYNLIRGLSPYPAAFTELVHKETGEKMQMKIFFGTVAEGERLLEMTSSSAAAGKNFTEPGSIASDGKTYLAVRTADGAIELTDIQLSGKKRMDIKTFLLGFRNPEDYFAENGTSAAEIAKTRI